MTKVSVYVDDSVWFSFKEQVFRKHGSLRKLSCEVEKLIRDAVVEDAVILEFEKIGINPKGDITSQQIKSTRPKSRGPPSVEIVREMRRKETAKALLRH